MKTILLGSLFILAACSDIKLKDDYILENQQLKLEIVDLKRKLNIALQINTCWTNDNRRTFYRLGKYAKDNDIYADLRVFRLADSVDAFGNHIRIWDELSLTSPEEIINNNYKISCSKIPK